MNLSSLPRRLAPAFGEDDTHVISVHASAVNERGQVRQVTLRQGPDCIYMQLENVEGLVEALLAVKNESHSINRLKGTQS